MQPVTNTALARPRSFRSAAARMVSIDSCLAAPMNARVLTITASARPGSATSRLPAADSSPATFSESTSLRPHPSVTTATVGGRSWSRMVDLLGHGRAKHHDATRLAADRDLAIHTPDGEAADPEPGRSPVQRSVEELTGSSLLRTRWAYAVVVNNALDPRDTRPVACWRSAPRSRDRRPAGPLRLGRACHAAEPAPWSSAEPNAAGDLGRHASRPRTYRPRLPPIGASYPVASTVKVRCQI